MEITDHTTHQVIVKHDDGSESPVDAVKSVTFVDSNGAVHTLTFHQPGTDVSGEAEDTPRVVGEDIPAYVFNTPEEAMAAYYAGKVK